MKYIKGTLDIVKEKLEDDYDGVYCIDGDEREGKSMLLLHLIEYWRNITQGGCTEEDIKFVCMEPPEFANCINDADKMDCPAYDEAGDINSRKAMSEFNVMLMRLFMVIGGRNLLTFLVLPKVKRLDVYLRSDRVRGLFHVHRRGGVLFWNKPRFRTLMAANYNANVFNYQKIPALYNDTYGNYKGILLKPYKDKKEQKIKTIKQEFVNRVGSGWDSPWPKKDLITELLRYGHSNKDVATMAKTNPSYVRDVAGSYKAKYGFEIQHIKTSKHGNKSLFTKNDLLKGEEEKDDALQE